MKVILMQDVKSLGKKGELVEASAESTRDGYEANPASHFLRNSAAF